jgi:hypothetical protein
VAKLPFARFINREPLVIFTIQQLKSDVVLMLAMAGPNDCANGSSRAAIGGEKSGGILHTKVAAYRSIVTAASIKLDE